MDGYAWGKHDGRSYGSQIIKDKLNNIEIKTEYLKVENGKFGGDWVVRISGSQLDKEKVADISLLFYSGMDNDSGSLKLASSDQDNVKLVGQSAELGSFSLVGRDVGNKRPIVVDDDDLPDISGINKVQYSIPSKEVWKVKDVIKSKMIAAGQERVDFFGQERQLQPAHLLQFKDSGAQGNIFLFQHALSAPFTVEYALISDNDDSDPSEDTSDHLTKDNEIYFGTSLTSKFKEAESRFDAKFESSFHLEAKGYDKSQVAFGKMLLSNMLGGMGYFHGTSIHDLGRVGYDEEEYDIDVEVEDYFGTLDTKKPLPEKRPESVPATTLFTGVPSRPFFPRGFLWDSGFDHHLIEAFDVEISLDIISHWASLIDENGWLAREQILGDESRSKVPGEFQIQYPHYANPPTLITALEKQVEFIKSEYVKIGSNMDIAVLGGVEDKLQFLRKVYPSFKRQYDWFLRTQLGQIESWDYDGIELEKGFKWRGRHGKHILTSGMDDYPRSLESHPGDLHVDLISWVSYFASTLQSVAVILDLKDDTKLFQNDRNQMDKALNGTLRVNLEIHWDSNSNSFTDVTFNSEGSMIHVVHKGYVSLTPLLLGLIPVESPKLGLLLDLIYDPKQLWSPYGICSLSKKDVFYGQDENYWRGPIWININYLLLQSLHKNYLKPGPYQKKAEVIYNELRDNLIKNVYSDYENTGYVWEQYSCDNGKGARSHPFTGWTSLILLIMTEEY